MSKKITEIDMVLNYHDDKLNKIKLKNIDSNVISETEKFLLENNIELPSTVVNPVNKKNVIIVESWDELLKKSLIYSDKYNFENNNYLDDEKYKEAINKFNIEFNEIHKLDNIDICISVFSGIIGAIVDIVLVGIPKKTPNGLDASSLSNLIRETFNKKFPEFDMTKLSNSQLSKVPYDAQDNRNTKVYVDGLSSYYHRMLQLGHDPFLGLVLGTLDILNGTMTTIDKKGKLVVQVIEEYQDRTEESIFSAITKQIIHFVTDINTSAGLPAPLMSLFNFCQFGEIGHEKLSIAEVVQGMYYEGYDFIHFCSLSVPVMLIEVITRLCYSIKILMEKKNNKRYISIKSHKITTMLFLSHSVSVAVNTGEIIFTKNPMAINFPQWLVFFKYSYNQLKWCLIEKNDIRDMYINDRFDMVFGNVFDVVNNTFDTFSRDAIVVIR